MENQNLTPVQEKVIANYLLSVGFTSTENLQLHVDTACHVDFDVMGLLDPIDILTIRTVVGIPISKALQKNVNMTSKEVKAVQKQIEADKLIELTKQMMYNFSF
jgi:hypothetical protein